MGARVLTGSSGRGGRCGAIGKPRVGPTPQRAGNKGCSSWEYMEGTICGLLDTFCVVFFKF